MEKVVLLILLIFQIASFGQNIEEPINHPGTQISRDEERRINRNGSGLSNFRRYPSGQISRELSKEGKALLTPSEKDFLDNKQFLKQSKTGIAKLFPAIKCNRMVIDAADHKCLQAIKMVGQGSYYSFRSRNNYDSLRLDIYFADGDFSTINSLQQLGLIVDLKDAPIESLDKNSTQLANLKNYHLPKTNAELISEKAKLTEGVKLGNDALISKTKVKLNNTYGLRLVNWTNGYYGGEDNDLLVVLRVIRENEDGSVVFIWREIQRKRSPKLKKQ